MKQHDLPFTITIIEVYHSLFNVRLWKERHAGIKQELSDGLVQGARAFHAGTHGADFVLSGEASSLRNTKRNELHNSFL